jgi:hypothetical protein
MDNYLKHVDVWCLDDHARQVVKEVGLNPECCPGEYPIDQDITADQLATIAARAAILMSHTGNYGPVLIVARAVTDLLHPRLIKTFRSVLPGMDKGILVRLARDWIAEQMTRISETTNDEQHCVNSEIEAFMADSQAIDLIEESFREDARAAIRGVLWQWRDLGINDMHQLVDETLTREVHDA